MFSGNHLNYTPRLSLFAKRVPNTQPITYKTNIRRIFSLFATFLGVFFRFSLVQFVTIRFIVITVITALILSLDAFKNRSCSY